MMRRLFCIAILLIAGYRASAAVSCSVVSNAGAGTVQISSAGAVTGTSTAFTSTWLGTSICVSGTCAFVTTYTSATSLTVNNGAWSGTTAGGQSYTVQQIAHAPTNGSNTVTFVNNFNSGDVLLWSGALFSGGDQLVSLVTGIGESFTLTPKSSTFVPQLINAYLRSTAGGTNVINVSILPDGDFLNDEYGMELSCSGGLLAFDTDAFNTGTPPSISFGTSSLSGISWAILGMSSATGIIASPYTSTPQASDDVSFGYVVNPSTPVSTTASTSNTGTIYASSLKFIAANATGSGGKSGFAGSSGYNALIGANLTIPSPLICPMVSTASSTTAVTANCNTIGQTLLTVGCNLLAAADTCTISDNQSNSYLTANCTNFTDAGFNTLKLCAVYNPTTSATHTFTCTSSGSTSVACGALGFQNTPTTASVLDGAGLAAFSSTATVNPSALTTISGGGNLPSTPKVPGEVQVMLCGNASTPSAVSMSSPYSVDSSVITNVGAWIGHYINSNGNANNPSCTGTGTTGVIGILQNYQAKYSLLPQVSIPSYSPSPGVYTSAQTVTLSSSASVICYSTSVAPKTNGSGTGCTTGTQYTTGITVSSTETIYAVAGSANSVDSTVASGTYTITSGQVTLVQQAIPSASCGTNVSTCSTQAFGSNTTAANTLIVCVNWLEPTASGFTSNSISSVSGQSSSWSILTSSHVDTGSGTNYSTVGGECAEANFITGGVTTAITVTMTNSGTAGGAVDINAYELATATGTVLYSTATCVTSCTTTASAGSATSTENHSFGITSFIEDDGSGSGGSIGTQGSGWTISSLNRGGGNGDYGQQYQAQATAGSITGNCTLHHTPNHWAATMIVLQP